MNRANVRAGTAGKELTVIRVILSSARFWIVALAHFSVIIRIAP